MHPFGERQEEGGVKQGGIKQQRQEGRGWHEKAWCCEDLGRSRGLDLCWDTYWALVKRFLYIENTILGKIHLASRLRDKGKISLMLFFFCCT